MTKNRRGVQGIGLFFLLLGIVAIATAAIMFFGANDVDLHIEDGVQIAQMYAIILGVIGLFQVVVGFVGLRAAKHDNLLKPFMYLCTFVAIVNIAQIGMTLSTGEGEVWQNLIHTATAITGAVFAANAMQEQSAR
ncbi:hypothetical protein [Enorma burkinafasonensis]|uniref:hypothetical protein n=1 Tax=Enorma burkinafasonensis TaxID=2590867 RepID=UPI0026F33670|nr:hypothetical protein [Enorma burkinafasonensis]MCI7731298.1 hypothetical protein [Enorma burkinafasonensis]